MKRRNFVAALGAAAVSAAAGPAFGGRSARAAHGAWIDVPAYQQQRNLSCEYAAAVMAMAAYGTWISEYAFDEIVGWSANPHWGYRGDITGWWGNTEDYGVYNGPLAAAVENFGFWGDPFYAPGDPSALQWRLENGWPTLVWIGLWGDTSHYEYTEDGTPFKLAAGMHVVTAQGYDDNGVYVVDPAYGTAEFYDWDWFMTMWNVLDGMGLSIGPY